MKKTNKENNKKVTVKSYIKACWDFVEENLKSSTGIFLLIAILVMALAITRILPETIAKDCEGICRDDVTIGNEMSSRIMVIVITIFAGIAPYIYAPVIGFLGGVINEVTTLSFIIKGHGYFNGILIGIVPLIINLIVICVATSLGTHICKMVTLKGKVSGLTGMNYTNFKIKLYEDMHNKEKVKELKAKQDEKIKKLNSKIKKIDYLQIFNVSVVIIILQIISILIQEILL